MSTTSNAWSFPSLPNVRLGLGSLAAWRRTLADSSEAFASEAQNLARVAVQDAALLEEEWRRFCRLALDGDAEEAHGRRAAVLELYSKLISSLSEVREAILFASHQIRRELPEVTQVGAALATAERKHQSLAVRWVTSEDLLDLAAEGLAPSREALEAARQRYGYPQAWYDDSSTPF